MNRKRWRGFGTATAALVAAFALLTAGCGERSAPSSETASTSPTPASAPPAAGSLPLVDSKGNVMPGSPGGGMGAPSGGELTWTVPSGWVSQPPASAMRKAQYALPRVPGDPEEGECAVFYFGAGQGGDVQANIERWAGQFDDGKGGHPSPVVTEGTVGGRKVLKVSAQGTYNPSAMAGGDMKPRPETLLLGAIVEGPDANWFFKCTGPRKTMEARRGEFDGLIASVKVP